MSEMVVMRDKRQSYAVIDLFIYENMPNLSWRSRGIHTYLMSRPPGWKIWKKDILNRGSETNPTVIKIFKELELNLLVHRAKIKNQHGKFSNVIYFIFEKPTSRDEAERLFYENYEKGLKPYWIYEIKNEDENDENGKINRTSEMRSSEFLTYNSNKGSSNKGYKDKVLSKDNKKTSVSESGDSSTTVPVNQFNSQERNEDTVQPKTGRKGRPKKNTLLDNQNPLPSEQSNLVKNKKPSCKRNTPAPENTTKEQTSLASLDEAACPDKYSLPAAKSTFESEAYEIMKIWEECNLAPFAEYAAAARRALVQLLKGEFYEKITIYKDTKYNRAYTKEEIITAIHRFAQQVFDNNFHPTEVSVKKGFQSLPMIIWIYDKRIPYETKSRFLKNVSRVPMRAIPVGVEDKFPELTQAIKNEYIAKFLGNTHSNKKWTNQQEDSFRKASIATKEFFDTVRLSPGRQNGYYNMAKRLVDCIVSDVKDTSMEDKVSIGWLCSDRTFNERLPRYLASNGLIVKERTPLWQR